MGTRVYSTALEVLQRVQTRDPELDTSPTVYATQDSKAKKYKK
jgi:hypothetical protein